MATARLRLAQAVMGKRETKGQLRPDREMLLGRNWRTPVPTASPFQTHTWLSKVLV